jgi:hypothetical protein
MATTKPVSNNATYLKARRLLTQGLNLPDSALAQLRKYLTQERSIVKHDLSIIAAELGQVDVLKLLHEFGDIFMANSTADITPMKMAIFGDRSKVVECLVEFGVPITGRHMVIGVQSGHTEVLKTLIRCKGDVNKTWKYFDSFKQEKVIGVPLYDACIKGLNTMVPILLEAKADLSLRNHNLNSPMHGAASGGHVSIVRQLIAAKAPCNLTNNNGCTPLMVACMVGGNHMIPILVEEAKVKIDQRNPSKVDQGGISFKGATAMHMVSVHALAMSAFVYASCATV